MMQQISAVNGLGPSRLPLRRATILCIVFSALISLAATTVFHRTDRHGDVARLSNLVGGTADGMLQGRGMTVTTGSMGTASPLTFHAARMPVATLVVVAGAKLLGRQNMLQIALMKAMLFLVPVWLSMALALRAAASRRQMLLISVLLMLPFAALPFLADVVNLQVEEGYAYSVLALAVALLLFPFRNGNGQVGRTALLYALSFACCLDVLYLSKSSMLLAVAVLLFFALRQLEGNLPRTVIVALVCAAPLGWACHQRIVSGRASFGTSLDGINLHKGNNELFATRYPPPPGTSLDQFDAQLSGTHSFRDEWDFHDFHVNAAKSYIQQNPAAAIKAGTEKAGIFFLSLRKIGSSENSSRTMAFLESLGLLVFRLALWSAVLCSASGILRNSGAGRYAGAVFLLTLTACAAPYVVGFAYTRHASILLYPAVLLLCRATGTSKLVDSVRPADAASAKGLRSST